MSTIDVYLLGWCVDGDAARSHAGSHLRVVDRARNYRP